jgi:hypothetical protein
LVDDADKNSRWNGYIAEEPEQYIQLENITHCIEREHHNQDLHQLLGLGLGYGNIKSIEQPCKETDLQRRTEQ